MTLEREREIVTKRISAVRVLCRNLVVKKKGSRERERERRVFVLHSTPQRDTLERLSPTIQYGKNIWH